MDNDTVGLNYSLTSNEISARGIIHYPVIHYQLKIKLTISLQYPSTHH